jgi:Flp pilus assembly protein TadB
VIALAITAVAASTVVAVAGRSRRAAPSRLAAFAADERRDGPRGRLRARSTWRLAAAGLVLIAGQVVVGGGLGLTVGVVAGGAVAFVRPKPATALAEPDEVAVVIDLVAGCLAAGIGMADALDAAALAADQGLRMSCRGVAAALRAGVPAGEAWQVWSSDPWLAPVARTAVRTAASGAAAAAELRRASARLRSRRRSAAQHKVRAASVWLVVPLGLCFLPAFVLVAVVPLVVGLLPSLH